MGIHRKPLWLVKSYHEVSREKIDNDLAHLKESNFHIISQNKIFRESYQRQIPRNVQLGKALNGWPHWFVFLHKTFVYLHFSLIGIKAEYRLILNQALLDN